MKQNREMRRSVRHTSLLSACGALFAWFAGTALELLPQQPAWCVALFALAAAVCAGILAAVIPIR
ncbi:MAG: hypothetical protein IK130_11025 [Oscillospiraceae bacterium]|nr:hypothetical protein [Oscillospiraceae bacterium]